MNERICDPVAAGAEQAYQAQREEDRRLARAIEDAEFTEPPLTAAEITDLRARGLLTGG